MNSNTMSQDTLSHDGRALVAIFADRDSARTAIHRLHDEGFSQPWLGVTTPGTTSGTTNVESDSEGFAGSLGRFFTGESGGHPLAQELVRHGVSDAAARQIDSRLPVNGCVLTVDGSNHPELATEIIEANGGHVVAGESFDGASESVTTKSDYATGGSALGYGAAKTTARGQTVTEQNRLQLRAERLDVQTQRVSAGEATVGKDVVSHQEELDVPVYHEELYIENRLVNDGKAPLDSSPIGAGETISIPLMQEKIQVSKRLVQTGEVAVGKRQVTETQRVRETIREERLRVDSGIKTTL